jgi:ribonuclease VapC
VNEVVLDASALLAYLNAESGAEVVEGALASGALRRRGELAEVLSKTAEEGGNPEVLKGRLEGLGV